MPPFNAGKDILQAFLAGHEEGRASKALKLKNEQETLDREARVKQHEDALKQADLHFNAQQAIQKALKDVQVLEHRANIAKIFAMGINPTNKTPVESAGPEQDINSATHSMTDPTTGQRINSVDPNFRAAPTSRTIDLGETGGGQLTVPDPFSYAQQQADLARTLQAPKIEGAIQQASGIAAAQQPFKLALQSLKNEADMQAEVMKFKNLQSMNAQKFTQDQQLVRLRASLRPAKDGNDKYLTPTELEKLNAGIAPEQQLPYGVTKEEAARFRIVPTKPRTAAEEARLQGFIALRKQLSNLKSLGDQTKYSQHIPVVGNKWGTIKNIAGDKLGLDTAEGKAYRTMLGKLNAKEIHDTYGSVFSGNERELSTTWLPNLAEEGSTSSAKMQNGINYLTEQIGMLMAPQATTKRGATLPDPNRKFFPQHGKWGTTKDNGLSYELEQ